MKKIIKRVLLSLLIIIVVAVVLVVRFLTSGQTPIADAYVTDAAGYTYIAYTEKDTTYVVVTDEDGNRWAAQYDGDTVGSTVKQVNDDVALDQVPTQFTGEHIDVTADVSDYQGNITPVDPNPPANNGNEDPSQNQNNPQPEPEKPEAYRIQKYQQMFANGTYYIDVVSIDSTGLEEPMILAVKNGNIYAGMNVEGMDVKMIYRIQNDTMYLLFDQIKKYCEVPQDILGEEMDMSTLTTGFQIANLGEISVSEVELNGKTLICESYISESGSRVYYYFDQNDMLVRRDWYYADGTSDTMMFSQISTDVSDSLFEIPKGYGYLNISWLFGMMQE